MSKSKTVRAGLMVVALVAWGCGGENASPDSSGSSKPAPKPSSSTARATASGPSSAGMAATPPTAPAISASVAAPSVSGSARATAGSAAPVGSFGAGGLGLSGVGEGGGCPCGCDRSERLLAQLRAQGGPEALGAVDFSLRTIAAREEGGYITERMVQHRLRLLGLDAEIGGPGLSPERCASPHSLPAGAPSASNDTTSVRLELIVHSEGTEIVNGEEKLLKACFLLRMQIANLGDDAITVRPPALDTLAAAPSARDARAPFEVSRWYVVGTAGIPWDGALGAHAEQTVNVIGYAGAPLAPATEVLARVRFERMDIPTTARARAHWNEVDR
jgi:hypothetical protein